jgi:hypothetical protein
MSSVSSRKDNSMKKVSTCLVYSPLLKIEARCASETSVDIREVRADRSCGRNEVHLSVKAESLRLSFFLRHLHHAISDHSSQSSLISPQHTEQYWCNNDSLLFVPRILSSLRKLYFRCTANTMTLTSERHYRHGLLAGWRLRNRVRFPAEERDISFLHSVQTGGKNVGASTSHKPMGLHGLLQGYSFTFYSYSVQTRFGAQPASYLTGTGGSFLGDKSARVRRWLLVSS